MARGRADSSPILVDDAGHSNDVVAAVRLALEERWGSTGDEVLVEIEQAVCSGGELRDWLSKKYFDLHARRYQDARRKAPIYLQLGVRSCRYSVWLHYPSMRADTLFTVLQDFVLPKVAHEERRLTQLIAETDGSAARQRKVVEQQEMFLAELKALAENLKRAAILWKPCQSDGTLVACAPLWKLFECNRAWQREVFEAWTLLQTGDWDWSATAMRLWPDRVIQKCRADCSLAIGHSIEGVFGNTPDAKQVVAALSERDALSIESALEAMVEDADSTSRARTPRRSKTTRNGSR